MSLRIIGGSLKRKRLDTLKGHLTRPTTDRVRESLFNILGADVNHAVVLDLFSGSGALGLEALSRGAGEAVLVDNDKTALTIIEQNVASCRLNRRVVIMKCNIIQSLSCIDRFRGYFNLVFMDPPYERGMVVKTLHNLNISRSLKDEAILVIEHSSREAIPPHIDRFSLTDQRKYGKTLLSFMWYSAN